MKRQLTAEENRAYVALAKATKRLQEAQRRAEEGVKKEAMTRDKIIGYVRKTLSDENGDAEQALVAIADEKLSTEYDDCPLWSESEQQTEENET